MEQRDLNLAIFRGRLKFKSNEQKIWGVLTFLAIITIIEVILGIVRPAFLVTHHVLGMKLLNWIFIILTLVKAYYITWDFMHMRDEKPSFQWSVVLPLLILIPYLAFILLVEGDYIFDVMHVKGLVSWDF